MISQRVAGRYTRRVYADYIGDMTRPRALKVLGFSSDAHPSEDEIRHAWKHKAREVHPDRGGTHELGVEVNVAKDFLLGEGAYAHRRPIPEPPPHREPPKPKPVVETIPGKTFEQGTSSVPAAEWLFISKTEWGRYASRIGWSADIWVVVGRASGAVVVVGVKNRKENFYHDPHRDGRVNVESDWEATVTTVPINSNLVTTIPKAIKTVVSGFKDGVEVTRPPRKFVAWAFGSFTEKAVTSVKYGAGGANLKDILLSSGLITESHEALKGRKSNVEIIPRYDRDRVTRLRKERAVSGRPVYAWEGFNYYVSVNGAAPEKLTEDTVEVLNRKGFFGAVFNWDPNDGVLKNLTKMRGGRFGLTAADVLSLLSSSMTHESKALIEAIHVAAAQWAMGDKTSYDRRPL